MDTETNSTRQNEILANTDRATDRQLLSMQPYKRYTVYQALFEIHPQNGLTVEGCMSKAALYILKWMKDKVNADADQWPQALRDVPSVSEWKDFVINEESPISDVNIKEPVRIRTMYWDNCWTMRFNEANSGFDGVFGNDISLTAENDSVVLAISTECRQRADSDKKAIALRPGYVSKMTADADMFLTEKLSDDPSESILKLPIIDEVIPVKSNGADVEKLYRLIADPMRNLPLIIVPKPEGEEATAITNGIYHDMVGQIDHHGVLGYYSAVYFDGSKFNKFIYCVQENTAIRQWIADVVGSGRFVMIAPWDGTDGSFKYYTWDDSGSGYVCWNEDSAIEDCLEFNEEAVEKINELKLSQEPVERRCNFGRYRFNRQLWNEWNAAQIESAKASENNEELIVALRARMDESEKLIDQLNEKLKSSDGICEELRAERQRLQKELTNEKKQNGNNVNTIQKSGNEYEKRLDILRKQLENTATETGVLFPLPAEWADVSEVLKRGLLDRIADRYKKIYGTRKPNEVNPARREDVLGMVYCMNDKDSSPNGSSNKDSLLNYPKNDEIYDNEYRNIIMDAIWDEKDTFLVKLASIIGYDRNWRETKKKNLLAKVNNYRNVDQIRGVLQQEGLVETSENSHSKWSLGGDERYKCTVASTPGDTNTGKNTVDDIMERFF